MKQEESDSTGKKLTALRLMTFFATISKQALFSNYLLWLLS
jgi:hypothetical protein